MGNLLDFNAITVPNTVVWHCKFMKNPMFFVNLSEPRGPKYLEIP